MIDGLWLVHAEGLQGNAGGGIAVFSKGKIYGGDSGFYYLGTYQGEAAIKATVAVHQFDKTVPSILAVGTDYELVVAVTVAGDTMSGTAMVPGMPDQSMALKLVKKANL